MNTRVRGILRRIVSNPIVWRSTDGTLGAASRAYQGLKLLHGLSPEAEARRRKLEEKRQALFAGLTVLNGPFKGMRYPHLMSVGSAINPKLLGSYESELAPAIDYILTQDYHAIVDIGCAEGYYAVGLGMKLPKATVYAYDTDPRALMLCQEMAALNGVKVQTGGFCTPDTLRSLDLGARSLIISDCEGYETRMFDPQLAADLRRHDFLIALHDMNDIYASRKVSEALSATHELLFFESVDDIQKAYTYEYPELAGFDLEERYFLLKEYRQNIMRWILAKGGRRTD